MNVQGWAKVGKAAKYDGISPRTVEDWLKEGILRYTKLPSEVRLIKYQWIDEALERFELNSKENLVSRIVDDALNKFQKKQEIGNAKI